MQLNPSAILFVMKKDKHTQGVDAMLVEKPCKDPISKDQMVDKIAMITWVARHITIPAMSQAAVLVTCHETGLVYEDTHPNVNRLSSAVVAKEFTGVMLPELFLGRASNVPRNGTHLPKSMIVPQRSKSVPWLAIDKYKWKPDETDNTVPLYQSRKHEAEKFEQHVQIKKEEDKRLEWN